MKEVTISVDLLSSLMVMSYKEGYATATKVLVDTQKTIVNDDLKKQMKKKMEELVERNKKNEDS